MPSPSQDRTSGSPWIISRRTFLRVAAGVGVASLSCAPGRRSSFGRRPVRFGVVTDCHYADADAVGTRFYRESIDKLAECVARMNAEDVDFLIELGDFKDQNRPPVEEKTLLYLRDIEAAFQQFKGPTYHVLGNHDMDSLSKPQFLSHVENTGIDPGCSYYSFDARGLHCIVLDANYKADGSDCDHGNFNWQDANIAARELDWLRQDLAGSNDPAIVFVHQLLDGADSVCVRNAAQVRAILERSGRVLAVFQGHLHEGRYLRIDGIHYYTLHALVEGHGQDNNAYAIVEVLPNRDVIVTGYRKAQSMELARTIASEVTPSPSCA
jgi:3',5'-cyclic AMP phosphodiesterase CpdA